jgi:membrane-associated protease RseP (regulator of RpoE activity)
MKVIPINRKAAVMLAATLATGTAFSAEQVERDDVAVPPAIEAPPAPPAAPAAPATRAKSAEETKKDRERDAKLREAQKRLESAAAEVAALSSEIASQAMQDFGSAWTGMSGPRRSIIGVQIEAADKGNGAKVREVSPGGAAEAAGIRVGDTIVAVNGTEVKDGAREVVRMLRQVEPESTVSVRVMRDGKPKDFKVTARKYDARVYAFTPPNVDFDFDFDPSPWTGFGPSQFRGALSGMEVTTLTPQLARYFGADEGLLVLRAPKGDTYKLQDGDVILNIDGRVPTNGSHVTRILRSYQPGEKLTLHIMRDRKPMDLQVTLPEDERARRNRTVRIEHDTQPL